MELKNKKKAILSLALSITIPMLSVVYCIPQATANAVSSTTRGYRRHDCSSSNNKSYTSYNLTLNINDNAPASRSVIGENNFVPNSDLAVVQIDGPGGTGFIIDDHTIVTAAHCVYEVSTKDFINFNVKITDTAGHSLDNMTPKYVHIPSKYAICDSVYDQDAFNFDYALIEVEEDLSEYAAFGLGLATDEFINNKSTVTVAGYPQYDFDGDGNPEWGARYEASGKALSGNSTMISYNADTEHGTSGGPVYVERNYFGQTYKTAIAINTRQNNSGPRITPSLLQFYYSNPNTIY